MAYIKVKDRRRFERKEFRDYIKLSDDKVLDTKKNNIDLLGDDEVFVQLEDTQHYWISSHGKAVKEYEVRRLAEQYKEYIPKVLYDRMMNFVFIPEDYVI